MKEGRRENRYIAECFIRRGKKIKNKIEGGNPYQIPAHSPCLPWERYCHLGFVHAQRHSISLGALLK